MIKPEGSQVRKCRIVRQLEIQTVAGETYRATESVEFELIDRETTGIRGPGLAKCAGRQVRELRVGGSR